MSRPNRRTIAGSPSTGKEKSWRPRGWLFHRADNSVDIADRSLALKERRWSASNAPPSRKTSNDFFDVTDKLMVRAEKSVGRMGRQLSLEAPARPTLRRHTSEDLKPGPLKIAWEADLPDQQPSVEVVAKKCGQPKPSVVKAPRSPYHPDDNAAVLYSRQQLTERLRTSWKKSSGRHNLNIFINQTVDSETDSVSEVLDSPLTRTPSLTDDEGEAEAPVRDLTPEPATRERDKSLSCSASDKRAAFRMMGRQSKISDSPCATPDPTKATTDQPAMRRMMSAPSRPPSKKLTKAASVESRIKSAPSKRKHKPLPRRRAKGDSSDEEKTGTRRVKRGVEKGEIVTMVSLVSPADSEDEEPIAPTPDIKHPPTPKPPPESPRPNPPPPPPILSLRKTVKAVSFRPVVQPTPSSTQYQTSFPLKRTFVQQHSVGGIAERPQLHRQATLPLNPSPSSAHQPTSGPRPSTAPRSTGKSSGTGSGSNPNTTEPEQSGVPNSVSARNGSPGLPTGRGKKPPTGFHPPSTVRRKIIQAAHNVIKIEPEPIKEAELPLQDISERENRPESEEMSPELEAESTDSPVFKNSKEKECWDLFKKMSDRGVSVSFETVLRGLLTPTEYRMRRAALMSVC